MPKVSPDGRGDFSRVALLLPAWKPEAAFVPLVRTLSEHGFGALIVVDDGSGRPFAAHFDAVAAMPGVTVLRHGVNLGKGRALKTGFNYLLTELPSIGGAVTADADGQHRAEDIVAVAEALTAGMTAASGGRGVLGVRALAVGVPLRSRIGNLLTRVIFRFVTGFRVSDTQTGLRGIPRALLPELIVLDGERYEYEMTMLAHLCRHGSRPLEVPIATVYIDGNRASHFDPIRDSMRIYSVLLRFYFSSQTAAIAGLSHLLIRTADSYLHSNIFAAKIVVDGLLSLVSLSAQRTFVFRRREAD